MKHVIPLLLCAVLSGTSGKAQTTVWNLDKSHSQIRFSVTHLVIAEVGGRFTDFEVKFQQPGDDFAKAKIEATIKTASINTDVERRDNHLRSDDFLNAEKYPVITFKSHSIEKKGEATYKIKGDLTIRDVTRPVVLDTKFNGTILDPYGSVKAGFKATTTINRYDFEVKWNAATEAGGLVAGKDIDITLLMEFSKGE